MGFVCGLAGVGHERDHAGAGDRPDAGDRHVARAPGRPLPWSHPSRSATPRPATPTTAPTRMARPPTRQVVARLPRSRQDLPQKRLPTCGRDDRAHAIRARHWKPLHRATVQSARARPRDSTRPTLRRSFRQSRGSRGGRPRTRGAHTRTRAATGPRPAHRAPRGARPRSTRTICRWRGSSPGRWATSWRRARPGAGATPEHEAVALKAKPDWKPETPLHGKCRVNVSNYGLDNYGDLFTARQLAMLTTFSDLIGEVRETINRDAIAAGLPDGAKPIRDGGIGATAYADSIIVYLACALSRLSSYNNSICHWNLLGGSVALIFSRQAIPMSWDFIEVNPLRR